MATEAPTRLDRAVLAVAAGPAGHLLATLLDVGSALTRALAVRLRARMRRPG
jgi:hypothetical protein